MGLFGRDTNASQEAVESIIGASTDLRGSLRSDGGLRIEGGFEGNIEVGGNVIVGKEGRVVGDISARNVTVGGRVKGNITSSGRLEILSTGHVLGDIAVASVMIDEGGLFQGTSRMAGYEQRALAAPRDEAAGANHRPAGVVGDDTVDVTPRPAKAPAAAGGSAASAAAAPAPSPAQSPSRSPAPKQPQVSEHELRMPDLDLDGLDIEPVIPDIVIEDIAEDRPPASGSTGKPPAGGNPPPNANRSGGNRPRRR